MKKPTPPWMSVGRNCLGHQAPSYSYLSRIRQDRVGPHPRPKTRTELAAIWPPMTDMLRAFPQSSAACWDPESKEAERFTEPDDNANKTTPADIPKQS
jgi:hypothetical protein